MAKLMKAVPQEDGELDSAEPATIARSIINAGFRKESSNG